MSSDSAAASAPAASAAAPSWVRVEYEGPNNTLAVMRLHVGLRVRVETDGPAPALGPVPASTEEEFASTAKATIRYIGPVAAARDPLAVMVGVEWDEPSRGKNDGMVGGRRYFSCSAPGKPASFLHPARIKVPDASSLLRAIETKYETRFKQDANPSLYLVAEHNAKAAAAASPSASASASAVPQSTPSPPPSNGAPVVARHIPVVFQGEEYMQNKIASKLASLIDMTLTQGHICRAFEPQLPGDADPAPAATDDAVDLSTADQAALLSRKIVRCETMDLTDNLLQDWAELGLICSTLPTLKLLAVSHNNMAYSTLFQSAPALAAAPSPSPSLLPLLSTSFRNLSVLVLNGVPDAWGSVLALACAGALPMIDELHVCKNQIASLSEGLKKQMQMQATNADLSVPAMRRTLAAAFPRLSTLELSFNALTAWSEVSLLADLPLLAKLLLNSNSLASVEYEESDVAAAAVVEESKSSVADDSARAPFASLVSIGLNSNLLSSFSSVSALSRFPALSEVRLQSNPPLEAATMAMNAAASGSGSAAQALSRVLNVVTEDQAHKLVSSAGEAATASSIPAAGLSSARDAAPIAFAPSAQSASLLRLQLIARLPRVSSLNRSRITDRERMDAEKYYLLVCFQALQARSAEEQNDARCIERLCPRYTALVSLHGDPAATVSALQKQLVEPQGSTLASKLVEVTLVLAEHDEAPAAAAAAAASSSSSSASAAAAVSLPGLRVLQSATKKLSSSLTVQAARMLLDKSFKIAAHRKAGYSVQWREPAQPGQAHPLDEPLKSLSYFGVCNGAWIVLLQNK